MWERQTLLLVLGSDCGRHWCKEWELLGWTVVGVLADVTAEASEMVGEGGAPAPWPVPEGKLHKGRSWQSS